VTEKYICIHGHFYQPPRENPWLEDVEFEQSAYPYHDWNTRITAECYAPNAVSRIMDSEWRIKGLVNNYSKISFNFGPTLLYWISRHDPQTYNAILAADKESAKNFSGHGSAMAQVFNHMIMPLANKRDKETQVKWGIRDFETRFGRYPEGMWLPETAVDIETLETLAENNIKFTILSSHQANRVRKIGENDWIEVQGARIDPRRAYVCRLPSGKSINLFFFDKIKSYDAAFGSAMSSGEVFANKLLEGFKDPADEVPPLVNMANDGEIYGHHHPHGDMTLAYGLYFIESQNLAKITNYSEYLEKHPPQFEVQIQENTSWSCSHGIERWRSDCGDNTGRPGWRQAWRKPLRDAMDWLRNQLASSFEAEAGKYLKDPWSARNSYISVILDRSKENVEKFLAENKSKDLSEFEQRTAMKLLEMQRQAMLMFTSCGWFFDEISGIETVQVMMYAARAMQFAKQVLGLTLEDEYHKILGGAPSNIPEFENGSKVFDLFVRKAVVDLAQIGAQDAILELFSDHTSASSEKHEYGFFTMKDEQIERHDAGKFRLVVSQIIVQSRITFDQEAMTCAAVWLGDHNVSCGVKTGTDEAFFKKMRGELLESFKKGEINEIILLMPKFFENNTYSLKDVFKDEQLHILNSIVQEAVKKATDLNEIIFHENSAMLRFMKEIKIPPPKSFRTATEISLNAQILKALTAEEINIELLGKLIADSKMLAVEFESEIISLEASQKIATEFDRILNSVPDSNKVENLDKFVKVLNELQLKLDLWHAQNTAFTITQKIYHPLKEKKDEQSQSWVAAFQKLCLSIGIRLD
jgi:alpha-amylase/alpha-mannosidase (GH57 family)